jgi:hypothetical protein
MVAWVVDRREVQMLVDVSSDEVMHCLSGSRSGLAKQLLKKTSPAPGCQPARRPAGKLRGC